MDECMKRTKHPKQIFLILIIVLCMSVTAVILFIYMKRNSIYQRAIQEENNGDYAMAYADYNSIVNFKDSNEKMTALENKYPQIKFAASEIGGIVTIGQFEQDNNNTNGAEDIEWFVLDKQEEKVLLLSRECLTCMPYFDREGDITWENCSLRKWLNEEFFQTTFTEQERKFIALTKNENPDEDMHGTEGGNDTQDYVFLLSEIEARVYLRSDESKYMIGSAEPTEFAKSQGISISNEGMGDISPWWLRSPGTYGNSAIFVEKNGEINPNGAIVTNEYYCGVRPAVWINYTFED